MLTESKLAYMPESVTTYGIVTVPHDIPSTYKDCSSKVVSFENVEPKIL